MIDRELLEKALDQSGLIDLISSPDGGLGWPVTPEFALYEEPEISKDVRPSGHARVHSLVPASADNPWLILLAEFEDEQYVRRDLRALLASLRRQVRKQGRFPGTTGYEDTIFIVTSPGYEDVRFVLFEERERRVPRIRSFGWHREFIGRTVLTHNLERLKWDDRNQWEAAWDVDALTDEFYDELISVFDSIKELTVHPGSAADKDAYVQLLLDRLLFIAFIERLGWLKTPDGSTDYLHSQWTRFQDRDNYRNVVDKTIIPATFNGLLAWLFFRALDNPNGVVRGDRYFPILGEVPYLNGGLFSAESDLDVEGARVADEAFDLILGDRRAGFDGGLFRKFNFTVTESTPLDQEAAVDPEMLGKIFERLVNTNELQHSGTYYTPRTVVEYMVNESLKLFLAKRGLTPEKAGLLVDEEKVESETISFRPSELQDTVDLLFSIRAVDPACGSGAYLLMLMQRLFELIDRLEVTRDKKRNANPHHLYNTKLRLLERCIYGVDINPTAVRIARLRMWLSLVVENRGVRPEPLPSFDYLIMCGDSLASPISPLEHVLGYPHDAIKEYTRLKREYFHPHAGADRPERVAMEKKRLEIAEALADELASSGLRAFSDNPFDWEVEFAEVFDRTYEGEEDMRGMAKEARADLVPHSGFDIVLANPPYIDVKALPPAQVKLLFKEYATAENRINLYALFIERSISLLASGGVLAFINPNSLLVNESYTKTRKLIVDDVTQLIKLPDNVFRRVTVETMLLFACRNSQISSAVGNVFHNTASLDFATVQLVEFSKSHWKRDGECRFNIWASPTELEQCVAMLASSVVLESVCEFSLGITPYDKYQGHSKALIASRGYHADTRVTDEYVPLIAGANIMRYLVDKNPKEWLRYGPWLGAPRQRRFFKGARIIVRQIVSGDPPRIYAGYTDADLYFTQIGFGLLRRANCGFDIYYILAVLNSTLMNFYHTTVFLDPEKVTFQKILIANCKLLPIPKASDEQQSPIVALAKRIVAAKSADVMADTKLFENEIDEHAAYLYFHANEAPTYAEWLAKREAEAATEVGALHDIIRELENDHIEFKASVMWDVRQNKHNLIMRDEVLKEICAFLNADGGTLLCGVNDDGSLNGLESDIRHAGNRDKLGLVVSNALGDLLRPHPVELVRLRFIDIDNQTILRIEVKPDAKNRYESPSTRKEDAGKNIPRTHVRVNASAKALDVGDAIAWWERRKRGAE